MERRVKHLTQGLPGSQPLLRSCPHCYRKPASCVLNLMLRFPPHPYLLPKGFFPQDLMKPSLVLSSCHDVIPPVQDSPHRWDSFRGCLWCKGPGAAVSSHLAPLPTLAGHEQALGQFPRNVRNERGVSTGPRSAFPQLPRGPGLRTSCLSSSEQEVDSCPL